MNNVTSLDSRRRVLPARLHKARGRLFAVLAELREEGLTAKEANALRAAIEEELRVLRKEAGL